jgi:hypothetical protein
VRTPRRSTRWPRLLAQHTCRTRRRPIRRALRAWKAGGSVPVRPTVPVCVRVSGWRGMQAVSRRRGVRADCAACMQQRTRKQFVSSARCPAFISALLAFRPAWCPSCCTVHSTSKLPRGTQATYCSQRRQHVESTHHSSIPDPPPIRANLCSTPARRACTRTGIQARRTLCSVGRRTQCTRRRCLGASQSRTSGTCSQTCSAWTAHSSKAAVGRRLTARHAAGSRWDSRKRFAT